MKISGIYCIRHISSGKVYIGSSADIKRRWIAHLSKLRRGVHHSICLQRAWASYGEEAFAFEVVELVEVAMLIAAETRHIEAAKSSDCQYGYNMAPVGGSTLGLKLGPFSEEHRRKIAAGHIGKTNSAETRAKISAAHKGRTMSAEWIAKIAAANTGRKMAPLSDEHKTIVSRTHKGKTISDAHKAALSRAHKGHIKTPEERAKRRASITAYWARKKAEKASLEQQCSLPLDHNHSDT